MTALCLNEVTFAYPDSPNALSGVTFSVEEGETVGLLGANGAGKSTLLLMLPGVLLPKSGSVEVFGTRLTKEKSSALAVRRDVGLVFQDADEQLFCASVFEDIAFGPRNCGLPEDEAKAAALGALKACGIEHLAQRPPYKLSGGEKRLAAIASVISMNPRLVVMDEPTSSLDPRARRSLIALLRSLPQTLLIASHDLDMVYDVCDKVIVLLNGVVAAQGETKALLRNEALMNECLLETPLRFQPG